MRLLDRYILNNFLIPFLLCFFGFLSIWLVFDLSDNVGDFIEGHVNAKFIAYFYLTQLPQITLLCMPVGLLLALLYALTRMSRTNEIIAMLTAGQSLSRILLPLMIAGLVLTGVSTALNYKLAPHAESLKKQIMEQTRKKKDKNSTIEGQLFRNRLDNRTWYVQKMPSHTDNSAVLQGLHIVQQDADGVIKTKWYARVARYKEDTKTWLFSGGKTVEFDKEGSIVSDKAWQSLETNNWKETPWRIASSNLEAASLSVPELRDYLHFNSDFPETQLAPYRTHFQYRWALPWQCLVVVFLAGPLGVVFSRRGMLTGVAGAIMYFFGMIFLTNLMLALGKGYRISAATAAWTPVVLFGSIGLYLLFLRSTNRELPKFSQLFRLKP
ncbi:MAG: LptF/LptG family permease [Verrucomicrobiota bacterium]